MMRTVLLAALCALAPSVQQETTPLAALVAKAETQLEAEEPQAALATLAEALEYAPHSSKLLSLSSDVAYQTEDSDLGLWYALLAAESAGENYEVLGAKWLRLDPLEGRALGLRDEFADYLFELGALAVKQRLYLNAVDLFARCAGTKRAADAAKVRAALHKNPRAVSALLATGISVPGVEPVRKKSAERIAREDKQHATWGKAWSFKSRNYQVNTNLGQEVGQELLNALDQMNEFYRDVFQYKQRGPTPMCEVSIYKSRAEFDAHEIKLPPTVMGFFHPEKNRVATFDPRSMGKPLSSLHNTLFHEASHQFTEMTAGSLLPGWLNEGTASYFEGVRILQNGVVETNLVPESRLRDLVTYLRMGAPSLGDVVSYHQRGSYPGAFYPFGWGLVYFARNYENERSERVYLKPYQSFMASYKTDEPHDTFTRFVEYFVERPREKGIATFADFEKRFIEWILELGDIYFGPETKAEDLIVRGRKQAKNGKLDAATASYRFALRKRPSDAVASFELGEVLARRRQHDAATFRFRRALAYSRADAVRGEALKELHGDPFLTCMNRVMRVNRGFAEKIATSEGKFIADSLSTAKSYEQAGYPRLAMHVLQTSQRMLGREASLLAEQERIETETELDARRWRQLPLDQESWELGAGWKGAGAFDLNKVDTKFAFYRGESPEYYRFEIEVQPEAIGSDSEAGLLFSSSEADGYWALVADLSGGVKILQIRDKVETFKEWKHSFGVESLKGFRIAVEVEPRMTTFYIDGKRLGKHAFTPAEQAGRIGLYAKGSEFAFRAPRILY